MLFYLQNYHCFVIHFCIAHSLICIYSSILFCISTLVVHFVFQLCSRMSRSLWIINTFFFYYFQLYKVSVNVNNQLYLQIIGAAPRDLQLRSLGNELCYHFTRHVRVRTGTFWRQQKCYISLPFYILLKHRKHYNCLHTTNNSSGKRILSTGQ